MVGVFLWIVGRVVRGTHSRIKFSQLSAVSVRLSAGGIAADGVL